ncbi:Alkaline/neutral invertase A mitochondrial [Zea mays]|uniref:Alkaline/neutral invertase A mitochondrial n=2 Tax=Zea mays TaxID=4577 RepID=A0A1R3LM96_MAIZE|nr:Alkaline/neutral invertase A mitochondrial [Zea mays]
MFRCFSSPVSSPVYLPCATTRRSPPPYAQLLCAGDKHPPHQLRGSSGPHERRPQTHLLPRTVKPRRRDDSTAPVLLHSPRRIPISGRPPPFSCACGCGLPQ